MGAPATPTVNRGENLQGWLRVLALWAGSVGVFGVILYLLAALQRQQIQAADLALLTRALRDGNPEQVAAITSNPSYWLQYPTSALAQFAVVGLVVIACAWLGRRMLAVAVPMVVVLGSLAPAYWGDGPQAPHPIGEDDSGLWGGLAREGWNVGTTGWPANGALPSWPLWLGIVVQTMLLVLPLVALPRVRSAPLPSRDALLRAAVPAAVMCVAAISLVPAGSSGELVQAAIVASSLAYVVTFLMVGDRLRLARVTLAVMLPAAMAPVLLETRLDTPGQGALLMLVVGVMAVIVVALTGLTRRLQTHAARAPSVASPLG